MHAAARGEVGFHKKWVQSRIWEQPRRLWNIKGHKLRPLGPPTTSYRVTEPDGYWITVTEYIDDWRISFMDDYLNSPQAAVVVPGEIWSRGPLEYGSKLYRHERAHIDQLNELGWPEYVRRYRQQWIEALEKTEGDPIEAHKIHPMEVDANRRAGLPDDWIQSGPADWYAP